MNHHNNRLTSPEITNLYIQYIQETMSVCIGKHVLATVKDPDICSIFEFSLGLSEKHLDRMKGFFN